MDEKKKKRLEADGWVFGSAAEFLGLTPAEERYIDLKIALGRSLRAARRDRELTQDELARLIGSSQSRVAKMEKPRAVVSRKLERIVGMLAQFPRQIGFHDVKRTVGRV